MRNKSPITSGIVWVPWHCTLWYHDDFWSFKIIKLNEIQTIILILQCWYFPKEKVTVHKRRIRVERAWGEFINKLALFIPQNLIEQNTVTSSRRSTGTFCHVIHGLSHVPKCPTQPLVKDSMMKSKACVCL